MIFDFRLRPPYKSFCNLTIFHPSCNELAPQRHHAIPHESARQCSMELFWQEMEAAGIAAGCAIGRQAPDDTVSVRNEDIFQLAREHPDKIIPFGSLDISRGVAQAINELEACLQSGARGIALEPGCSMPPRKADANVLYPVYARCEQAGIPVVLTMSPFQGDLDYSEPTVLQHVARDFPKLQIVVAHGCYPWIPMVFQLLLTCPNIWLLPDIYMYNPMAPGNRMYGEAFQWLDGERILFGSAYPCYNMKQAIDDMERFQLSERHKQKFFRENARKLLQI